MRDCVGDWREEIAEKYTAAESSGKAVGMMWIQPWLLEALLDRIAVLEGSPENGSA
jgi:hypothetical protein